MFSLWWLAKVILSSKNNSSKGKTWYQQECVSLMRFSAMLISVSMVGACAPHSLAGPCPKINAYIMSHVDRKGESRMAQMCVSCKAGRFLSWQLAVACAMRRYVCPTTTGPLWRPMRALLSQLRPATRCVENCLCNVADGLIKCGSECLQNS